MIENKNLILTDTNNVINHYNINNQKINNNELQISNLNEGNHNITLSKQYNNNNQPIIFYQSQNSQTLMKTGNLDTETINLEIQVIKTNIKIYKIDSENKNIYPQGESSLNNAIFGLYDENMNLLSQYKIINNITNIENIDLGKYYIKEISPGTGYNLNTNTYEISITENDYNKELTIENNVIKKRIIIEKKYGETNLLNNESNIKFEIYNNENNLIQTIITNNNGIAEITLPYGKYTFKQINTTTGYQKIEPFIIEIKDNIEEKIELTDYKIQVPNTSKNKISIFKMLYSILINMLCF